MRFKFINSKHIKKLMTFVMMLCILSFSLPCNCMAGENPKPVESEHPCHSSTEQPTDTEEHNNCCCSGGDCISLVSDTNTVINKIQTASFENNADDIPLVKTWISDQALNQIQLIRGSPSTVFVFSTTNTFLAKLSRWLI